MQNLSHPLPLNFRWVSEGPSSFTWEHPLTIDCKLSRRHRLWHACTSCRGDCSCTVDQTCSPFLFLSFLQLLTISLDISNPCRMASALQLCGLFLPFESPLCISAGSTSAWTCKVAPRTSPLLQNQSVQFLPLPCSHLQAQLCRATETTSDQGAHHRTTPATPRVTRLYSLSSVFSLPTSSFKTYSKRKETLYQTQNHLIYQTLKESSVQNRVLLTQTPPSRLIFLFAQQPLCQGPLEPLIFIVLLFTSQHLLLRSPLSLPLPASHSPKSTQSQVQLTRLWPCQQSTALSWSLQSPPKERTRYCPEQRGGNIFGNYWFIPYPL